MAEKFYKVIYINNDDQLDGIEVSSIPELIYFMENICNKGNDYQIIKIVEV